MMTDAEAESRVTTCPNCGGLTEEFYRGRLCPSCKYVWVGNVPIQPEAARVHFVAGNLVAKCLSQGTILPRFYVGYSNAMGSLDPSDKEYFREAIDELMKIGLIARGVGTETYGLVRDHLSEANQFAVKWADPKRVERISYGKGDVKHLGPVSEPAEVPPEPATPTRTDLVDRSELDYALRTIRQELTQVKSASGLQSLVDLELRIHGLEGTVEELAKKVDHLTSKKYIDEEVLAGVPSKADMEASENRITKRMEQAEAIFDRLIRVLDDTNSTNAQTHCLCGRPAAGYQKLLERDPESNKWTQVADEVATCTAHNVGPVYRVQQKDQDHFAEFAKVVHVASRERKAAALIYASRDLSNKSMDMLDRLGIRFKIENPRKVRA